MDKINEIRKNPLGEKKRFHITANFLKRAKRVSSSEELEKFSNSLDNFKPFPTLQPSNGLCEAAESLVQEILKAKNPHVHVSATDLDKKVAPYVQSATGLFLLSDHGDADNFLARSMVSDHDPDRLYRKAIFSEEYNYIGASVAEFEEDEVIIILFAKDVVEKNAKKFETLRSSKKELNKMREIIIDKLILNISVGASGDKMTKAIKVLKDLTQQEPITTKAKFTIRSFGIKRNEEIGTHVTIRGATALELLKLGLKVKDNELRSKNFSNSGNFGFGIQEHIDLGLKYDPNTGIYGMDFYVVLKRKGLRVSQRKRKASRIGPFQRVSKKDAQKWFVEKLGGTLV